MSTQSRSAHACMAAEPVSPEVAPSTQTRSPRADSTWSNSRPTSCSATSLNASVGPRNSSSRCRSGPVSPPVEPSGTTGHTSGVSKVA